MEDRKREAKRGSEHKHRNTSVLDVHTGLNVNSPDHDIGCFVPATTVKVLINNNAECKMKYLC